MFSLLCKLFTFNVYHHLTSIYILYLFTNLDQIDIPPFLYNASIFHLTYYIGDSIYDYLSYNRFIYVIHHAISCIQYIILINNRYKYDKDYMLVANNFLLYSDISALIINFRDTLKKENSLHLITDYFCLTIYAYCRCYKLLIVMSQMTNHMELVIIPSVLYFTSLGWTYLWTKKLITKTFKKIKN